MQQVASVWAGLDMRKRVVVAVSTVAVFLAVIGLSRMATAPQMALLYAGLEQGAAGDVVKALEARNVAYQVRGGSIFVDSSERDGLRMTLASEGLPANSGKGYELLDGLSGFGTTSQMFDAAYWRAKEGELARTIVTSPLIQNARVHIGNTSTQRFRQRSEPTASVTVTTSSGSLPTGQAKALKYLVASAVPGLAPDRVSIIDSRGGLLAGADDQSDLQGIALDRASLLKQKVERLLEARVGLGNAVVELNLDTATEQESITERRFDPETRVAISTETQESSNSSNGSGDRAVTVASNLPDGDAAGGGSSASNASETRERINYEVSETTREILKAPGTTKRLTVAVLVDGIRTQDAAGNEVWSPRGEEELANLRELVAGAVGYDEQRGDQITIKSMQFELAQAIGSAPAGSWFSLAALDIVSLFRVAALMIVTLVLGLFVLRPILSSQAAGVPEVNAAALPVADSEGEGVEAMGTELPTEALGAPLLEGNTFDSETSFPTFGELEDVDLLGGLDADEPDPVERLRNLIAERQSDTVEILRGWMEDDEETVR